MNYEKLPISGNDRLRFILDMAWEIFFERVVSKKIKVNKEASMQLHYSSIIKEMGELMCILPHESFSIELESKIQGKNMDITCSLGEVRAAIELKCFRKVSKRAVDIDMYNVLKDIERLQAYEEFGIRKFICLTDYSFYSKADHKGHAGSVSIKDGVSYKKGKPIKPSWIGRWKLKNRVTPIRLTQNISFKWINKEGWYYIKLDI